MTTTATTPSAASALGLKVTTPAALHDKLLAGLPFSALTKFLAESGLPPKEVYAVIRLPARTLARRKVAKRLSADESEHLLRLAELYQHTRQLFGGNADAAREWLLTTRPALRGYRPIDLAHTATGTKEVEDLIFKLEYGIIV